MVQVNSPTVRRVRALAIDANGVLEDFRCQVLNLEV